MTLTPVGPPLVHTDICQKFFASTDHEHQERANFMDSLHMARSGAIHQGVFTSGSLTSDGRARVDAFVDRWHCRRSAQRSGRMLSALFEYLGLRVRYENEQSSCVVSRGPNQQALLVLIC